ncbi:DUF5988 family protein [Streptomyces huiliensis]|uniref:DUF5988 family protein n=1 Tax=Streptomyces huiliensis TaxID=2876027 RepID=UPI001CC02719|nr:DUF5988 family protein [Streptomyces huiliensis]MBZ4319957.1 DUF5988 family protein [Streptomyces huiliensis]
MTEEAIRLVPAGRAVLTGGPASLPRVVSLRDAALVDDERLIITHRGRNEHYRFTGSHERVDRQDAPVASWQYSTAVAE